MRCTMLKISSAVLLLGSCLFNVAEASLITDNGSFTTVNTLDWMDWSETIDTSRQDALTNYPAWRIATVDEANSMLLEFFGTVPNSAITQEQYDTFVSLFGVTYYDWSYAAIGNDQIVELYYINENNKGLIIDNESTWTSADSGIALVRTATTTSVPEPTYMAFLGLGLIYLSSRRLKKVNH
jgi:hypothetical protein